VGGLRVPCCGQGGVLVDEELGGDDRDAVANVKVHIDFANDEIQGLVVAAKDFDGLLAVGVGSSRGGLLLRDSSRCACAHGARRRRTTIARSSGRARVVVDDGAGGKGRGGSRHGQDQPRRKVTELHCDVVVVVVVVGNDAAVVGMGTVTTAADNCGCYSDSFGTSR